MRVTLVLLLASLVAASPDNATSHCKEVFTYGYGYRQFFHLSPIMAEGDGALFTLRFRVRARSDAHILLSASATPEESDSVYEVVLGAGKNTFSDIRRRRRAETKSNAYTSNILSSIEMRGFWVRMSEEGLLSVGTAEEELPFMQWRDPQPLDIQYFSFCTWSGVTGKWLYDCTVSDNDIDSIEVQRPLTDVERLRKSLLTNYDVYSRPVKNSSDITAILIEITVKHVHIDMKSSIMTVASTFNMIWNDEKMVWNPDNFNNLTSLNLVHHEIWKPELMHLNAAAKQESPLLSEAGLQVTADGWVKWRPVSNLQVYCALDLEHWPWDTQECSIHLGFINQPDFLVVRKLGTGIEVELQNTNSEWMLLDQKADEVVGTKLWAEVQPSPFKLAGDDYEQPSSIVFSFKLKRNNHGQYFTVVCPILVIMVMSLCCFWMDPLGREKLTINCLLIVTLCGYLMSLDNSFPPTAHTPYLYKVYGWVTVVVSVATVVTVCLTNCPHSKPPPKFLVSLMASPRINSLFCLPSEQLDNPTNGEDLPTWIVLVVLCDRVSFVFTILAYTAILL